MLEFKENQSERLLIPREIAACELDNSSDSTKDERDVSLYTFVPFGEAETLKEGEGSSHPSSKSPAVIRILKAPPVLWSSIRAWVHEDANAPSSREVFLEKVRH